MADKKKTSIIEAGLDIIADEGILAFNLTRIAKKTGISKSLISYHYKGLDDILEAIFNHAGKLGISIIDEYQAESKTPLEKLDSVARGAFTLIKKYPKYGDFFFFMYHHARNHENLFELHKIQMHKVLERIKLDLFETNTFNSAQEVNSTALAIHSLLLGSTMRAVSLGKKGEEFDKYLESVLTAIHKLLKE
jgi:AcrR family transcriptional regulator